MSLWGVKSVSRQKWLTSLSIPVSDAINAFETMDTLLVLMLLFTCVTIMNCQAENNKTFMTTAMSSVTDAPLKSCKNSSLDLIEDCSQSWRVKDTSDRENCCSFLKLRRCIRIMLDEYEDCSQEEANDVYDQWRNKTDSDYATLSRRCREDYSSDSLECLFLNHKAISLGLIFLVTISFLAFCASFIWLLFKKGSVFHIND